MKKKPVYIYCVCIPFKTRKEAIYCSNRIEYGSFLIKAEVKDFDKWAEERAVYFDTKKEKQ